MRQTVVILLAVGFVVGCSRFDAQLQTIRVGMTKAEVECVLGQPDDVQTPEDHAGTWTLGTSEVWSYGAECHRAAATKGSVYFDEASKVQYVFGQRGLMEPRE
jgi:hypothetical protein